MFSVVGLFGLNAGLGHDADTRSMDGVAGAAEVSGVVSLVLGQFLRKLEVAVATNFANVVLAEKADVWEANLVASTVSFHAQRGLVRAVAG